MSPILTIERDAELSAGEEAMDAVGKLLLALDELDYDFLAPTPASHTRVLERGGYEVGHSLLDLLGWSIPCRRDDLPRAVLAALSEAGLLERRDDGMVAARVRVSRVFGNLFIHSRFPTVERDAVFLGPDSHRFADFILRNVEGLSSGARVLDYGAGAGVGGITAASRLPGATLTLADINPKALAVAAANAAHARIMHDVAHVQRPEDIGHTHDLVVMHPPFMIDAERRAYRDGGDLFGGRLSYEWALEGAKLLAPCGRLIMHTGASIVAGRDVLRDALKTALPTEEYTLDYHLLDPDIYGDELSSEAYAKVDRIAAVGLRIDRIP